MHCRVGSIPQAKFGCARNPSHCVGYAPGGSFISEREQLRLRAHPRIPAAPIASWRMVPRPPESPAAPAPAAPIATWRMARARSCLPVPGAGPGTAAPIATWRMVRAPAPHPSQRGGWCGPALFRFPARGREPPHPSMSSAPIATWRMVRAMSSVSRRGAGNRRTHRNVADGARPRRTHRNVADGAAGPLSSGSRRGAGPHPSQRGGWCARVADVAYAAIATDTRRLTWKAMAWNLRAAGLC